MNRATYPSIDSRIQSYLRFAASQQRDTEQIGSFLVTFNRFSDNPFLNYAIPDDGAAPSSGNVNALINAYEQRDRKPRLDVCCRTSACGRGCPNNGWVYR